MFDILLPPYDRAAGCSYYAVDGQVDEHNEVMLKRIPEPPGLPIAMPYTGPAIHARP
jgi:hypothetical protein